MIVRTMKIHEFIAKIFQHRQCRWRPVDELAISSTPRESPLQNQIVFTWLYARFGKLRIEVLQSRATKDCLDGTKLSSGANQGFVRALTQQKLQRANNDRFPGACFSRDGDKPRPQLPLEFFHEREISNSQ